MTRTVCAVRRSLFVSLAVLLPMALLLVPLLLAQGAAGAKPGAGARAAFTEAAASGEQRAVRAFERAKADKANALALDAFLAKMPKGGDLHMHLSGAVYAETFLKDAAADGLCVNPKALNFVKNSGR